MSHTTTLERILDSGLVAVIRSPHPERLGDVAEALLAGGVDCMEVTFTVPAAHRVLEAVSERMQGRGVLGAGTVLDGETARLALLSGAKFLVSPSTHPEVIAMGRRYAVPVMPGALTPTEIVTAWQTGGDVIKVFPSELTGPTYLKALRGPLPQIRLMPTGGVHLQNAADYLRAGAVALGVGSSLVDPQAIAAGKMERIESLAREFVSLVGETREAIRASST